MSTYVISDIHGCYQEFLAMLDKIDFSDEDNLIMAGDYIDRGKHSYEMLKYMENYPSNVILIRGNHEEEFAAYVKLMLQINQKEELVSDFSSNEDAAALYDSVKYFLKTRNLPTSYFDLYGTIGDLVSHSGATLGDLCRWAEIILKMPYYHELSIGGRDCVVVHAGYTETLEDIATSFSSLKEFYLYAREEGYQSGGKRHGMVIAGHTPTIVKGEFVYHEGKVFRHFDKAKDCVFYDIDCGCVFRNRYSDARLACIWLDDEKIFYV